MSCCVIGGAGFIGSHLVRALLETGRDVRVVGRRERELINLPPNVKYFQADIGDTDYISKSLKDVDEIVDLAYSSVPKTSFESPLLDIIDNLPGSVALFETASKLPIRKMIFVSSGGTVYGEPQNLPITENHSTNPISPYGISKLALEKYAQMYCRTRSLPVINVRPANPFGEGQRPFVGQGFVATSIASLQMGKEIKIFGRHGTIRDYIYVGDLAKALIAALDYGVPGECYNIGSSVGRSNIQVIEQLSIFAKRDNISPCVTHIPSRSFDVSSNVLSTEKLYSISGWRPETDFTVGIERTWNWYNDHVKGGLV